MLCICGYDNPSWVNYCLKCLRQFSLEEKTEILCPNGHPNPGDARYCGKCRAPLKKRE